MLLSALIFSPLVVALGLLLLPLAQRVAYGLTVLTCALQFLVGLFVCFTHPSPAEWAFVTKLEWLRLPFDSTHHLLIHYHIGIDGLNSVLLALATGVLLVGAVASWTIPKHHKSYFALYLLLNTTIVGCFLALDFFLFFLFFELMLIPMYFLIGLWGGERREYAAIKFVIYTFLGSIFILAALLIIGVSAGQQAGELILHHFDLVQLRTTTTFLPNYFIDPIQTTTAFLPNSFLSTTQPTIWWGLSVRHWVFILLLVGFAIKLPVAPLHTWLPDAHVEAPTPISVVLAGILLKIGGYGLLRIAVPIFPDIAEEYAYYLGIAGTFSIVYAALVALGQTNLKKMIAYSSVSHMGFVLLGIGSMTVTGYKGAVFQLVSHGILSSMLFLSAGVLYYRTHDLQIAHYKGLAEKYPVYTALTAVAFFASLGLPTFSGFIGEMLVLWSAIETSHWGFGVPAVAATGLLLGAGYFLWTLQRMFLGKFSTKTADMIQLLTPIRTVEIVLLLVLALLSLLLGVYPQIILDRL